MVYSNNIFRLLEYEFTDLRYYNSLRLVQERNYSLEEIEITLDDLDGLFALYAGEGMTEYLDPLYEYEKEKEYQRSYINYMYRLYGNGMWVVIEKATGKQIGRVGIENREACDGEPELGYMIDVSYQRKGYATEVCLAVIGYAWNFLDFE